MTPLCNLQEQQEQSSPRCTRAEGGGAVIASLYPGRRRSRDSSPRYVPKSRKTRLIASLCPKEQEGRYTPHIQQEQEGRYTPHIQQEQERCTY